MRKPPFHPVGVLLPVFLALLAGPPAGAKAQEAVLVDRIVAEVGDSAITLSQIQEQILQLQYQQVEVPPEDSDAYTQLQRDLLDQMVAAQLIVQAALKDTTIIVDDATLDETLNQDLQERAREFGGQVAFQQALQAQGWTLTSYREFLRAQARQQQLSSLYLQKRSRELSTIVVENAEIEAFFETQRAAIGQRPPSVVFKQVVISPTPSDSSLEEARQEAERIRSLLVEGEDFEEVARRFSQDPGSAANGGELGWFRRGDMVPAFEEAAFGLVAGSVSEPVETPYGYHIIRVDRRRAGEVRARHILISVEPGPDGQARALERAREVRNGLDEGESIDSLIESYGDPEAPDSLEIPFNQLQELPPGFAEPLLQSSPEEVIGPLEYQVREGVSNYAVLQVLDVREGRPWSLDDEDLRSQIRQRLQQQKLQEKILRELRSRTYVKLLM